MRNNMAFIFGLAFWLAISGIVRAHQENGLLLYDEPPGSFVEVIRFSSIADGTAYATVVFPNGAFRHCWNGGIIARVDYPDALGVESVELAPEHIKQIGSLLSAYPQYRTQLRGALEKWQNALSVANQLAAQHPVVAPAEGHSFPSIMIDGTEYKSVTLTRVDGDRASITHEDGVTDVPLAELSAVQLTALNSTSRTVRIQPDWKERLKESQMAKVAQEKLAQQSKEAAIRPGNDTSRTVRENEVANDRQGEKVAIAAANNIKLDPNIDRDAFRSHLLMAKMGGENQIFDDTWGMAFGNPKFFSDYQHKLIADEAAVLNIYKEIEQYLPDTEYHRITEMPTPNTTAISELKAGTQRIDLPAPVNLLFLRHWLENKVVNTENENENLASQLNSYNESNILPNLESGKVYLGIYIGMLRQVYKKLNDYAPTQGEPIPGQ